jgi:hypothetical protein
VSSLTAQAKQYPLKKPGGFHWDFFLLGCTTFISGIIGIPLPNGLVPQAPVHTESLTIYETELKIITTSDDEESEIRRPVVVASKVVEQRISHFLVGIGIIGTMTGPLLIVLQTMPRALFAGVFFVIGVCLSILRLDFMSSGVDRYSGVLSKPTASRRNCSSSSASNDSISRVNLFSKYVEVRSGCISCARLLDGHFLLPFHKPSQR